MVKHIQYKLKKELGLIQATFAGLGIILGAGIYALLGEASGIAGNSVWLSFLISAIIASFTGLSYAELSSMYPKDSAEGEYAERAFSKRAGFMVAWLIILGGVISAAAVSLAFGGYLSELLRSFVSIPIIILAIFCLILFSFVNFWGIKESSEFNIISTLIEGGGLILIIVLGINYFGSVDYTAMANGWSGTISAAALIFFAYLGFQSIARLSEETKDSKKTIPRALILSIILSTILYVAVAVASISILGWEVLGQSKAPLADVAAAVLGNKALFALGIIAVFSTANTVLMGLVVTSRLIYGMSRKFKKLRILSSIHKSRRTPYLSVFLVMIFAMVFSLIGDVKIVAEMTNFSIFITFIIVNVSLIKLRRDKPKINRPFRVPLNIKWFNIPAFLGIITTLFLVFYLSRDWRVYVGGFLFIILGLIVYEFIKE